MSMADRDGKIWIDGELVDWRDAKIHVLTHTLHYGTGVFEGVRAYETDQGPAVRMVIKDPALPQVDKRGAAIPPEAKNALFGRKRGLRARGAAQRSGTEPW